MRTRKILFYCLAALMGGCVPVLSLQPLYTEETLVFNEQLLGTWVDDANDPESSWEFTRMSQTDTEELPDVLDEAYEKVYRLRIRDEEQREGRFVAALVSLDGKLFLDVLADRFPSGQQDIEEMKLFYNAFLFVPGHSFLKVDLAGDRLKLHLTNDDDFQRLLDDKPKAIAATDVEDRIILTAPTEKLQAFAVKYADDERVFSDEVILERKRP
ncbi:MAG: hypothetical protein ACYTAS_07575 [Planctomycetota bacterium]